MRTSIEISDALLTRAKKVIARRGTTLRALVEEGLAHVLEEKATKPFKLRDGTFKGRVGFATGKGEADISKAIEELNEGRWP